MSKPRDCRRPRFSKIQRLQLTGTNVLGRGAFYGVLFAVIAMTIPLHGQSGQQEDCNKVIANGTAPAGLEEASGYQNALRQAYYSAIERGLGVFVNKVVSVKNHRDVVSLIYSESNGYISAYDELRRTQREDGSYFVEISAIVCPGTASEEARQNTMQIYNQLLLGRPRVSVVASGSDDEHDLSYIVSALQNSLLEASYRIVEPEASGDSALSIARQATTGDGQINPDLLRALTCDIVIVAGVDLSPARRSELELTRRFLRVDASVTYKAISPQTGVVLYSGTADAIGLGLTPEQSKKNSLQKISEIISMKLIEELPRSLTRHPKPVRIKLSQVDEQACAAFPQLLESLPDVYAARSLSWSAESSTAEFEADLDPIVSSTEAVWSYLRKTSRDSLILIDLDRSNISIQRVGPK